MVTASAKMRPKPVRSPSTAVLGLVVAFFLILSPLFGAAEAAGTGAEAAETGADTAPLAREWQPLPAEESTGRLAAVEPTPIPTLSAEHAVERGASWLPAWAAPLFDEGLAASLAGLSFVQSSDYHDG